MDRSDMTSTGLEVYARLDHGSYPNKIRVAGADLEAKPLYDRLSRIARSWRAGRSRGKPPPGACPRQ